MKWDDLDYWQSGEWQVVQERLDDLDKAKVGYNPLRINLFAALDTVPFDEVKVVLMGQDPYPTSLSKHATGNAFDIPSNLKVFPPTLRSILQEYAKDLTYPMPKNGSLQKWMDEGVLLWNAIPTVEWGKPLSHRDWHEWTYLTKEIVQKLSQERGPVFVFIGGVAREYVKFVDKDNSPVIEVAHPSPRAKNSNYPFSGSRIFSRVNALLVSEGKEAIDWRL